jgi:hypothetical protein
LAKPRKVLFEQPLLAGSPSQSETYQRSVLENPWLTGVLLSSLDYSIEAPQAIVKFNRRKQGEGAE